MSSSARAAAVQSVGEGGPLRARAMRSGRLFEPEVLDDLLAHAGDPTLKEATLLARILTVEQALRMVDASVEA